jgi:hypothetical protein
MYAKEAGIVKIACGDSQFRVRSRALCFRISEAPPCQ